MNLGYDSNDDIVFKFKKISNYYNVSRQYLINVDDYNSQIPYLENNLKLVLWL